MKKFMILVLFLLISTVIYPQYRNIRGDQFPKISHEYLEKGKFKSRHGEGIFEKRDGIPEFRVRYKDRSMIIFDRTGHPRKIYMRGSGIPREMLPPKILKSLIKRYGLIFNIRSFEIVRFRGKEVYKVHLLGGGELYYSKKYRLIMSRD